MTIILSGRTDAPSEPLARAEVELPHPDAAPAATPTLSAADLERLAGSEHVLVRSLIAERIVRSVDPKAHTALALKLLADPDPGIRGLIVEVAGELGAPALEPVSTMFKQDGGEIAGQAARALALISPARLFEDLKARARLDDAAYGPALSAVALLDTAEAADYLSKSMNRAGALSPERRAGLYSAVLLSGKTELATRAIGAAVSESRGEEAEGGAFPTRIALTSLCGLPPGAAAKVNGESLWKQLGEGDPEAASWLDRLDRRAVETAIRKKDIKGLLLALSPALDRSAPSAATAEQASVMRRRQGSLRALVSQSASIATLDAAAAGVFAAAALSAAELVVLASEPPESSPAAQTLGKLLEAAPAELAAFSSESWVTRLREGGERKMRQIAGVLANEAAYNVSFVERILEAMAAAGGASVLLETAATAKRREFAAVAVKALVAHPAEAEPVAREVLERRPLEEGPTRIALAVAARSSTQRLAAVIGRRFYELREIARYPLIDAVVQLGDVRLLPLLASRAFPDEPEELGYVVLSLVRGDALEGKLKESLERALKNPAPTEADLDEERIRLPLRCKHCKETLSYAFRRVYVDPKSEAQDGDPAFVGEVKCKACGTPEQLESTPAATAVMSNSMMELLVAQRSGIPPQSMPLVLPRTLRVKGKEVGLAKALRELDEELKLAPDSVRGRLRRGRVRLILWRSGAAEDADAVLAADPRSPEGFLLRGSTRAQRGDYAGAVADIAEGVRILRADAEPRLYEGERDDLRKDAEDGLLELEALGAEIPAELDLEEARQRRDLQQQAEQLAAERMQQQASGGRPTPQGRPERPAFLK